MIWKNRNSKHATYRALAMFFVNAGRTDYAYKVCSLLMGSGVGIASVKEIVSDPIPNAITGKLIL